MPTVGANYWNRTVGGFLAYAKSPRLLGTSDPQDEGGRLGSLWSRG